MKRKLPLTTPFYSAFSGSFISKKFPVVFYRKLVLVSLLLALFAIKATANKHGAVVRSTNSVTLLSITAVAPTVTNATLIPYLVTFSGDVTGLTTSNFLLTTSNITGASVTQVTSTVGSGAIYTLWVNTGTGDGPLMLSMVNSVGLSATLTNTLPFAGNECIIDKTAPAVGPLYMSSNNANYAVAVLGNTVTLVFGSNEPIQIPAVTIGGHNITAISTGVNTYSASYVMTSDDPYGRIHFTLKITDLAGNSSSYNDVAAGADVEYTKPITTLSNLATSSGSLSPSFDASVYNYSVNVANNVKSITITPTVTDLSATVKLNDSTMSSGSASAKQMLTVGPNVFSVIVTAADGVTTQTYKVTVTRASSAVATLAGVFFYGGTLTPQFSNNITDYTVSVPYSTLSAVILPVATDVNATIKVNGNIVASGSASQSTPLAAGKITPIIIAVTAQDGVTVKTYTINVSRAPSATATLANITLNTGTLSPAFTSSGLSYKVSVPNGVSSIAITPVATDANATITVNEIAVASGAASAVALSEGDNKISIKVMAQDGVTTDEYVVTVNRAATGSNNVNIKMGLSTGSALTYQNSTGIVNYYTTSVAPGTHSLTIVPTTADANATLTVDGQPVTSGTDSQLIPLNSDTTTIIVGITAADRITKSFSRVTVSQNGSSNIGLAMALSTGSAITYNNNSGIVNSYTTSVAHGTASVTLRPTAADSTASIIVNGHPVTSGTDSQVITLNSDTTTIIVGITAADGVTKRINRVTVSQNGSSNISLAMGLSTGSAITYISNSGVVNYHRASVNPGTPSVTLRPTAADPTAVITVNGQMVTSGTDSQVISLNSDTTTIIVGITAADGITKRINRVAISQNGSSNIGLAISLSTKSAITYNNNSGIVNSYTTSITHGTASVTLRPTAADPAASITVNGHPVTSGTDSQVISLNSDTTTIIVGITAADGITKRINRVTVSQNGSSNIGLTMSLSTASVITYIGNTGIVNSYTASVSHGTPSVTLRPTAADPAATIVVDGHLISSGTYSQPISLNNDTTTIIVGITAADGITKRVNRVLISQASIASSANHNYAISPFSNPQLTADEVKVHEALSPNGDGRNDFLVIDGITTYPDNKLTLINRNGEIIFEDKGYDNTNKVFDGHSNKTGTMQQPGTYFYSLQYKAGDQLRYKTGYIILKY